MFSYIRKIFSVSTSPQFQQLEMLSDYSSVHQINNKQLSVSSTNHQTNTQKPCRASPLQVGDLPYSLIKSEIPNYSGSSQHRGAQYCPEWQESFVCAQETERASGPPEQWSVLSHGQSQGMSFVL